MFCKCIPFVFPACLCVYLRLDDLVGMPRPHIRNLWTLQHGCISRHLYYVLFTKVVDARTCGQWSKVQERTPFQMILSWLPSFLPSKALNSMIRIVGIQVPILPLRSFCTKLFPSMFQHVDVIPTSISFFSNLFDHCSSWAYFVLSPLQFWRVHRLQIKSRWVILSYSPLPLVVKPTLPPSDTICKRSLAKMIIIDPIAQCPLNRTWNTLCYGSHILLI